MSVFTDRLINLRESHDWSKTYVANHIGLKNMQTYANWEYGRSEPDQQMLINLANLFDVTVDYLLGRTKDPNEEVLAAAHLNKDLKDMTEEQKQAIFDFIEFQKKRIDREENGK
ncbi:helix-turn-helix domain-containing protein [Pediococcus acidilactici]|uniref:helix-turn-helix domain-containing protein n=1 Tax=Pediococcus acidilactici TaxID=1254 RepID=UPI0013241881|nr:helix-turn-helix transcriptional regulator [Pediococcus acidilactici]KAF0340620.1 helix-turn-helix domain-containing protein [Pediococcus acidilactici]KAF0380505.1 helix-turn-helix domain-containing protein [Pediococcus acidilactici]KAF0453502.1 helix-turn-helix domain-containing protein [Pediococcus acidilactici]KAF0463120.1 helix-turn-helix domain-containing protein [Pediococcus acidilactici]KAF0488153.1 helix-turn-helix domain-containing protein [Pediococcus acidilactici]